MEEDVRVVTIPDWVGTVAPALTALAAWVALGFSIYNAYARRRDRKPRVEMVARWNLPSNSPQVMRGAGRPATADPGQTIFQLDNGDSQLWLSQPFNYEHMTRSGAYWTHLLALDSAGNSYHVRNRSPAKETERPPAAQLFGSATASVVGTKGGVRVPKVVRLPGAERRSWWRRLFGQ